MKGDTKFSGLILLKPVTDPVSVAVQNLPGSVNCREAHGLIVWQVWRVLDGQDPAEAMEKVYPRTLNTFHTTGVPHLQENAPL